MTTASINIAVSAGLMQVGAGAALDETVAPGLKLGLVISGRFGLRVDCRDEVALAGPSLCLLLGDRPFVAHHDFPAGEALRYVTVALDSATLHGLLGEDAERLSAGAGGTGARVHVGRADRAVCALGMQISACPFKGGVRQTYLAAKALELVATVTGGLLAGGEDRARRLAGADLERLHDARRIILEAPGQAPSLAALARQVGLNVRKLTDGFRRCFGCSVADFIAEHRLQEAFRMLSSGEVGVAEAAYRVGYTPNHFTSAFRKRFGMPPSRLR